LRIVISSLLETGQEAPRLGPSSVELREQAGQAAAVCESINIDYGQDCESINFGVNIWRIGANPRPSATRLSFVLAQNDRPRPGRP
jgi:hypothetical protein